MLEAYLSKKRKSTEDWDTNERKLQKTQILLKPAMTAVVPT